MANKTFNLLPLPAKDLKIEKSSMNNTNIDIIFSCENEEIDLETSIPPVSAYQFEQYNYPRFIETGRPKSYMIQMCKQIVSSISDQNQESCQLLKDNIFLPVLRYQGIFFGEEKEKKFCGTFYYFEPESSIMLNLGRCAMFGSKIHAYIVLSAIKNKTIKEEELNKLFDIENIVKNKKRYDDLKEYVSVNMVSKQERQEFIKLSNIINERKDMTNIWSKFQILNKISIQQMIDIQTQFYIPIFYKESDVKEIPFIETTALYPTNQSKIFKDQKIDFKGGIHDDFDQPICNLARELKIDTILLQHEIGGSRSVSEILDTRTDSYDQLVRIKDYKSTYKVSKKYPTIFFLEQGFIKSITSKCKKVDIDRDNMNVLKCSI